MKKKKRILVIAILAAFFISLAVLAQGKGKKPKKPKPDQLKKVQVIKVTGNRGRKATSGRALDRAENPLQSPTTTLVTQRRSQRRM